MAMITYGGGLNIKILKRMAKFNICSNSNNHLNLSNNIKFIIQKKKKLSIEQSIKEKSEPIIIHKTFQQSYLRLNLSISARIQNICIMKQQPELVPLTLRSVIFGLGPCYIIKLYVTSVKERLFPNNLFFVCRSTYTLVNLRVMQLPFIGIGFSLPIIISLTIKDRFLNKIQILLCHKERIKPLSVVNLTLPIVEDEIEF
jgi:Bardet-Biedl syndrome 1 protein